MGKIVPRVQIPPHQDGFEIKIPCHITLTTPLYKRARQQRPKRKVIQPYPLTPPSSEGTEDDRSSNVSDSEASHGSLDVPTVESFHRGDSRRSKVAAIVVVPTVVVQEHQQQSRAFKQIIPEAEASIGADQSAEHSKADCLNTEDSGAEPSIAENLSSEDLKSEQSDSADSDSVDSGYYSLKEQDPEVPQLDDDPSDHTTSVDVTPEEKDDAQQEPATVIHSPVLGSNVKLEIAKPMYHQHQAQSSIQPTIASNRCHRRSSESNGTQPPRLKRDTDSADVFVNLLIAFTCRLITAIWPLAASPPMMTACFNGAGVLPLHTFIHETLRRSKTSYSTLQIALYYLVMLKPKLPGLDFTKEQPKSHGAAPGHHAHGCRAMQCGRRMFLAALMLASKYIQDRNYSTRAWSKISGLRIPEINDNEREYLNLIDYNLHMKQETFENWSRVVLLLSRISKLQPGCFQNHPSNSDPDTGAKSYTAFRDTVSGSQQLYTDSWWNGLCKDLDSEPFKDSARTDAFIARYIPINDVALSTQLPPLPSSTAQGSSDLTFSDPLGSRGSASAVSTPVQMAASSPALPVDMPMRPQLRNLQTPQSTPPGPDFAAGPGLCHVGHKVPRASASADALGNLCMRKQALNASIDRCPPPRPPQCLGLASFHHLSQSMVYNPCTSAGPSPPSTLHRARNVTSLPELMNTGHRSRSSSISSSSSSSSSVSSYYQVPRSSYCLLSQLQPGQSNGHTQLGPVLPRRDRSTDLRRESGSPHSGSSNSGEEDQAYKESDVAEGGGLDTGAIREDAEAVAASVLMGLRVDDRQSLTPRPALDVHSQSRNSTPKASLQCLISRGHKRTISKLNENLHSNVACLLRESQDDNGIVADASDSCSTISESSSSISDDSSISSDTTVDEREQQQPTRRWAQSKRPVCNAQFNKRVALGCGPQQRQLSAAEQAQIYLRTDLRQPYVGWYGGM